LISSFVSTGQTDGKVYAVLFYLPTCPHCHQLMTVDLPPIQEQFGENLVIFFVDISTGNGNAIAYSAYDYYDIPREDWVVPMMVINDQVLIGGNQIPSQLPTITQQGLDNGGIPVPSFPLMQEAFEVWQAKNTNQINTALMAGESTNPLSEGLENDPLASTLAIAILIGLVISAIGLVMTRQSGLPLLIPRLVIGVVTLLVVFIGITITLAEQHDMLALPIARFTFVGMLLATAVAIFGHRIRVTVSLVSFIGIAVSAYMAYIEITASPAVCGSIGNCNAVQQSDYAYLLGIPIGVIGVIGYLAMFIISITMTRVPEKYQPQFLTLLQMLVGASAVFTIYLTFLEPFVIGAVCAWCLLSSLIILTLMWLVMPMVQDEKHHATHYLLYQAT
jgi:uncharacterized membrane protein/thiol-disulfide isomerase/thioredoxin